MIANKKKINLVTYFVFELIWKMNCGIEPYHNIIFTFILMKQIANPQKEM